MALSARKPARVIPFGYGAEAAARRASKGEPSWLAAQRAAARQAIAGGLPSQKVEAWKYTGLQALAAQTLVRAADGPIEAPTDLVARAALGRPVHGLVFVNGRFVPALSERRALPAGVTLEPLSAVLANNPDSLATGFGRLIDVSTNPLAAFNTAFCDEGVVLRVARGVALADPVHLVFVGVPADRPVAFHPRVLVEAGEGSVLTLIETHVGEAGANWSNPVAEIAIAERAQVRHWTLQDLSHDATHLGLTRVSLARGARYESVLLALGAAVSRHEIDVRVEGEGAEVGLHGGYLLTGSQHSDHTTRIEHKAPRSSAREVYKGVLDGRSRGVFQGTIVVHPGADKTDAHQLSRTLMLTQGAEADAKPELMIYADDVKCSHGASSGSLDPVQLFYLRSRGIDEAAARALLVEGFIAETIEHIADEIVRECFGRGARAWLDAREGSAR